MMQNSLLMVCVSSLVGVFFVLIFLATVMELIMAIFPEKKKNTAGADDAAIYAAITSTYARTFPGSRIGKIEEITCRK